MTTKLTLNCTKPVQYVLYNTIIQIDSIDTKLDVLQPS